MKPQNHTEARRETVSVEQAGSPVTGLRQNEGTLKDRETTYMVDEAG